MSELQVVQVLATDLRQAQSQKRKMSVTGMVQMKLFDQSETTDLSPN